MNISVVIRSKNDVDLIGQTLSAIRPAWPEPVEIISLDSGSTDGTRSVVEEVADLMLNVNPESYVPGVVLNRGAREATGDIVVFLNSDCVPADLNWLKALVAPILAGDADATFGQQLPRDDAWLVVAKDNERAFGDGRESAGWHHFFSVAVSAFRREVVLERPFPEEVQYSEDLAWFWQNRAEVRVRYVPEARVVHSHNYPPEALWKRFKGEGRADAVIFADELPPNARLPRALLSAGREVLRDWTYTGRRGALREALRAVPYRFIQRLAYWHGVGEGRRTVSPGATQ
jgi:glycosyltransferase involved in cell wall biosynthesis